MTSPATALRNADRTRVSIVGCVGLPAQYGGFETLAANIVAYRQNHDLACDVTVYCSTKAYSARPERFAGARLRYVPLNANGAASVLYDIWSILDAIVRGERVILILGVSGAIVLPLVRLVSRARLVVNIDGLEWKRPKWSRMAALFLKMSEWIAVRAAHVVVADNRGIVDHILAAYGKTAIEIPYGGDHAVSLLSNSTTRPAGTPPPYALMLCRIEPENHIHVILDAFARADSLALVAVGNWAGSDYGRNLRDRYRDHPRIRVVDPVFDKQALNDVRAGAVLYVHGHSAGGTNPALVEMMHFATPIVAFDCSYNRYTTENVAVYFADTDALVHIIKTISLRDLSAQGVQMRDIARRRYTWDIVGRQYFKAMGNDIVA